MGTLQGIKIGLWVIRVFPAWTLRPLPTLLGFIFYLAYATRRRIIIANQRQVLGAVSGLRLHWNALRVVINLFRGYHVLARLVEMTDEQIRGGVELCGEEHLRDALARGRGVIILGAHIAGYNILAPFTALYHSPSGTFVEAVRPPELFDFVSKLRARTGLQLFPVDREGALGAMRLLKGNGVLMVAGDRYLGKNGTLVRLFGRPTYLSHGPIVLSQRSGAPILPARLRRLPDGRLSTVLQPPLQLLDTGRRREDLAANMRLLAGALEETIRAVPDQWLVAAPVWSTDPAGQEAATLAVEAAYQPLLNRPATRWLGGGGFLLACLTWARRRSAGRDEG